VPPVSRLLLRARSGEMEPDPLINSAVVIPANAGIQYSAASLGLLDRPLFAGDDTTV
jgi:hypothetical protein